MSASKSVAVLKEVKGLPAETSPLDGLLVRIRPEWQTKRLVRRVSALLSVDPSSACQRLLNAAIKDLQSKIVIAGIDLAGEAAKIHKLPPVTKADDVLENYSTTHTLQLAYRIGLLTRPEWRRLELAYDIRKNLEREDDEYEAQPEDCVYVFSTCVNIVLAREPIELIYITDVKAAIESPDRVSLTPDLLEDYGRAPEVRQTEIIRMLVGVARADKQPDLVRQNAVEVLRTLEPLTMDKVKITVAADIHESLKGQALQPVDVKISAAIGAVPYLKQRRVAAFFADVVAKLGKISPAWTNCGNHAETLTLIDDYGGLAVIPKNQLEPIVLWLARCYLGEKGGYGSFGRNRDKTAGCRVRPPLEAVMDDKRVQTAVQYKPIAWRLERLLDLTEE